MASKEEVEAYIERLKKMIKAINDSNIDKETKEHLIDELLDKLSIVLTYFFEE